METFSKNLQESSINLKATTRSLKRMSPSKSLEKEKEHKIPLLRKKIEKLKESGGQKQKV